MTTNAAPNAMQDEKTEQDRNAHARACALLNQGDTAAAEALLKEIIADGTTCWEAYNDLAAIALTREDVDAALDFLQQAVSAQSAPGQARIHLATLQKMLGQFEPALATLSPLLRREPTNIDALTLLRQILGEAPQLGAIAWARLLADLRTPTPEQQRRIDRAAELETELQGLALENQRLRERTEELRSELRVRREDTVSQVADWNTIRALSDEDWLQALIRSVEIPSFRGFPLPTFPADSLQIGTVGSSNAAALQEGYNFFRAVKTLGERHGSPLRPDMRLLDFGTGWGRYARLFMKEVPPDNIVGVDVDPGFVAVCRETFPYCRFETVPAFPPSRLETGSYGLVIAYSVFSHLSEEAARAWIAEFERLLEPGGVIAITTQGRSFLEYCEQLRQKQSFEHPWHQNLARSFVDREACERDYDAGRFLFAPTGGGDNRPSTFYGEALIPRGFVEQHWTGGLELLEFIDDRNYLPQALIVLRKRR